jgi:hypothetical protein
MQQIVNIINRLDFETVICYGVGVPSVFFNRIKGDKLGVDKYDKSMFPRLWSYKYFAENVQHKNTKKKADLVIINDSKRFKDLKVYFSQALKNIKEGGKIILIDSMPKEHVLVTDNPSKNQGWCGDVYQFVLELISKGGYKVTTLDDGNGLSIIELDETKGPKEIEVYGFEEWYFERKKLMSN